jgi:hypothetical protein
LPVKQETGLLFFLAWTGPLYTMFFITLGRFLRLLYKTYPSCIYSIYWLTGVFLSPHVRYTVHPMPCLYYNNHWLTGQLPGPGPLDTPCALPISHSIYWLTSVSSSWSIRYAPCPPCITVFIDLRASPHPGPLDTPRALPVLQYLLTYGRLLILVH